MKRFNEIDNFKFLKCDSKLSNDDLKKLHYALNDVIYQYNNQFAYPANTQIVLDKLINLFQQIKELKIDNNQILAKQNELLTKGRSLVKSLKNYIDTFKFEQNDNKNIDSIIKFQFVKFKKIQQQQNKIIEYYNLICENKFIYDNLCQKAKENNVNLGNVNIPNFQRLQKQLINKIIKNVECLYIL